MESEPCDKNESTDHSPDKCLDEFHRKVVREFRVIQGIGRSRSQLNVDSEDFPFRSTGKGVVENFFSWAFTSISKILVEKGLETFDNDPGNLRRKEIARKLIDDENLWNLLAPRLKNEFDSDSIEEEREMNTIREIVYTLGSKKLREKIELELDSRLFAFIALLAVEKLEGLRASVD